MNGKYTHTCNKSLLPTLRVPVPKPYRFWDDFNPTRFLLSNLGALMLILGINLLKKAKKILDVFTVQVIHFVFKILTI